MKISRGNLTLEALGPTRWRIAPFGKMRVPVEVVATRSMLERPNPDRSLQQACNVACLPGVLAPVAVMADFHQGYGFPIGGVAAFHPKTGIVSPGGVGYDINCGVRLLTSPFTRAQLDTRLLSRLLEDLFETIPTGVGARRRDLSLKPGQLDEVLSSGVRWAIRSGFGETDDETRCEERGVLKDANPDAVSPRARERGEGQVGTLGSGNHFVEIQTVAEVLDPIAGEAFGIWLDQIVVTVHTGSRGLGYQVCTDHLDSARAAGRRYGIELPDPELACTPLDSPEGKAYLGAMGAAANFAFANRQIITHWVRETFRKHLGPGELPLLYDLCHNIAKREESSDGRQSYYVHRKGATRSFPPKHPSLPAIYREVGQPVIVPGDMGRASYLLVGTAGAASSFSSACHGAGRVLSRTQAKKAAAGRDIAKELKALGVTVRASGGGTVVEEMPEAYKAVGEVVEATTQAGLARPVARLAPLGVIKG